MRKALAKELENRMAADDRIWLLVGDVGYPIFDEIQKRFSERFVNCGVAEQAMIGIAVGLANSGKIPFAYSITPFLLYRPYEFIRILIHYDKANVKLISSGRGDDYADHNYSHVSPEDKIIMSTLSNIKGRYPETAEEIPSILDEAVRDKDPFYINIKRK